MVQEYSIKEEDLIFLIQTKNESLRRLLSDSVQKENLRLESVESSVDLEEKELKGQIIAFVIGSDIPNPIQSAQRFHAFNRNATIVLLARPENVESLRETVKFAPFIGTDVVCVEESEKTRIKEELDEVLNRSLQAKKYQDIIAESNTQLTLTSSSRESALDQNFINRLMDIAPIGIAIVSRQGNILGWNNEAVSIFNKSEAQALGKPISRYFNHGEDDKLKNYLNTLFKKRTTDPIDSLSIERTSDEEIQVLNITAAPFSHSGGSKEALILTIKDVTQNVDLLNQLKTEIIARDNFLSMASHELKTPLTTMKINLELLRESIKRKLPGASGIIKLNNKSLEQADQLNLLIEELFDIAKIHSGKLEFNLTEVNLSELVTNFVTDMERKFREVDSKLILDIEPDVTGIWDKSRLSQAFANLITNALKYAPGAPIKVVLKTEGKWAVLSVHDQGPGISEEKQEKIFDRFERATASKTKSGLGLGLFITKKIVEGHTGEVQLKSTPGQGSTFTLRLPLNLDPGNQPANLGVFW